MAPIAPELLAALAAGRGLYLSGDDHLRITTFNAATGVTLAIEGRLLDEEGRVNVIGDRHVPNTNRTTANTIFRLPKGWLLDVSVRASVGTPLIGQCFAVVELVRGFSGAVAALAVLAQGYVTATPRLGWPGSGVRESVDGPGVLRSIAGTQPGAGAEVSETVPTGARWELLVAYLGLTTSATVANRNVGLTLDDGTNAYFIDRANANATAGASWNFPFTWGRFQAQTNVGEIGRAHV